MTLVQWLSKHFQCTEREAAGILRYRTVIEQLAHDEDFLRGLQALSNKRFAALSKAALSQPGEIALRQMSAAQEARELPRTLLLMARGVDTLQRQYESDTIGPPDEEEWE